MSKHKEDLNVAAEPQTMNFQINVGTLMLKKPDLTGRDTWPARQLQARTSNNDKKGGDPTPRTTLTVSRSQ